MLAIRRNVRFSSLIKLLSYVGIVPLLWPLHSEAKPQYATQFALAKCTACHVNPTGGGVRTVYGKLFGARNFKPSAFSKQDMFYADARMLYYRPDKFKEARGGLGWMEGNFAVNLPIIDGSEDHQPEVRFVYTHNVGGFPGGAGGPQASFLRWRFFPDTESSWKPQYVTVGRFMAPFGILNDEHRTYTRIQAKNNWSQDLEMGALVSGDPLPGLHYDIGAVNGEKTAGQSINTGNAALWGIVGNLRWTPISMPFSLGGSITHHDRKDPADSPRAWVIYGLLSLNRLTNNWLRGSLVSEYSQAKYWNSGLKNFVSSSAYETAVANTESSGLLAQLNLDVTQRLALIYKYDRLNLDKDYPKDAFVRHSVGAKYYLGPNLIGSVRAERSEPGRETERNGTGSGAQHGYWALLQVSM